MEQLGGPAVRVIYPINICFTAFNAIYTSHLRKGHHSCVECAKMMITWSAVCPVCSKPHNGAYTIDLTDDLFSSLTKNVPTAASSSTATAPKAKAKGKSTSTPKQPKKAPAKPRAKLPTGLGPQIMATESEVETLRANETALISQIRAQAAEIESMRGRVSVADQLRATLDTRVASLIQENSDIRRERDVSLTEKGDAEKRLKKIEDDRLGQEVRWIRQVRTEEQKGKGLQEQLDKAEKRANNLQEILTHHKNKVTMSSPTNNLVCTKSETIHFFKSRKWSIRKS